MGKVEFRGTTYEYDESLFGSWRWQRAVCGAYGPAEMFAAIDALFEDPEAVADSLGDDADAMVELLGAVAGEEGDPKGSAPSRQRFKATSRR